jgi:hypothetical protein
VAGASYMLSNTCSDLYREVEKALTGLAGIGYGYSYLEASLGSRKLVIWCADHPLNIVADIYRIEEREGAPYEVFIQRIEFGEHVQRAIEMLMNIVGLEKILWNIRKHIKIISSKIDLRHNQDP